MIYNNFSFGDFFSSVGVAASLTLITFGSVFAAGYGSGLLLAGKNLSQTAVKAIGSVVGGLVGSEVRTGTFTIITTVQGKLVWIYLVDIIIFCIWQLISLGKEIKVIEITLNSLQGLIEGTS